jgi:hypothetical protein
MWAHVSTFSVPKQGSADSENEDAAWVSPNGDRAGDVAELFLRIVVADGASESLLAGPWARWLTAHFGSTPTAARWTPGFLSAYRSATEGWGAEIDRYVEERERRGAPIAWYEEPGLAKGAFSTVLSVEMFRRGSWRASALGDSCVFQVRNEYVLRSFPLHSADAFSNYPPLLPSCAAADDTVRRNVTVCGGDWERGDAFYVMTDALAAWFLRANDAGERPWEALRDLGTPDLDLNFSSWVNSKRDEGTLHNDDTTLVRVDIY